MKWEIELFPAPVTLCLWVPGFLDERCRGQRVWGEGESCLGADGNLSVVNSQASCVSDGCRMEHFLVGRLACFAGCHWGGGGGGGGSWGGVWGGSWRGFWGCDGSLHFRSESL